MSKLERIYKALDEVNKSGPKQSTNTIFANKDGIFLPISGDESFVDFYWTFFIYSFQ